MNQGGLDRATRTSLLQIKIQLLEQVLVGNSPKGCIVETRNKNFYIK